MSQNLQVGQAAPDFSAPAAFPGEAGNSPLQTASLADYAGRWLVFFWYPADFTVVCPTEITALSDRLDEFTDLETDILGASTDSVHAHRVWMGMPRDRQGDDGPKNRPNFFLKTLDKRFYRPYNEVVEGLLFCAFPSFCSVRSPLSVLCVPLFLFCAFPSFCSVRSLKGKGQ